MKIYITYVPSPILSPSERKEILEHTFFGTLTNIFSNNWNRFSADVDLFDEPSYLSEEILSKFQNATTIEFKEGNKVIYAQSNHFNLSCGVAFTKTGIKASKVFPILEKYGYHWFFTESEEDEPLRISFQTQILNVQEIKAELVPKFGDCVIYHNAPKDFYKKVNITFQLIELKNQNLYDFSGDDLSLDPRMW